MPDKRIGFIGGGNMGSAIIGGIISSGASDKDHISAADQSEACRKRLSDLFGIDTTADNGKACASSDILFLAVKPNVVAAVADEIKNSIRTETVIVSIAAGTSIKKIEGFFGKPIKLIRAMPNTPALVGASMSALCKNSAVSDAELSEVKTLFDSFGRTEIVSEKMMNTVTGISGSSPAYVYLFIEAMADAAVADGMPRTQAYTFAAQSVLGSAKMVLETGKHPGELKDMVCSPGGTTIEAVAALERRGFRSALIEAQRACVEKSARMSKE